MKLILALSLCLALPAYAMDSEKNDPHTHLLAQATEASAQKIKNHRKKIAAAWFITLLTIGGVSLNGYNAFISYQPITHQAFPYANQLPLGNATCTYQATVAQKYAQESSLPIANPFGSPEGATSYTEGCFANETIIPDTYCNCATPPCKVILETCQDKDPSKENVVAASMGAIAVQLCAWITYLATCVSH